jgi:hypothetical protein
VPVGRLQEREHRFRHLIELNITSAYFVGDVAGHVTRPAFSGVEGNDADRIAVLA